MNLDFLNTLTDTVSETFATLPPVPRNIGVAAGVVGGLAIADAAYYAYWRSGEKSHQFNAYTTGEEAIDGTDLTGKIAVVTGCNSGIGKETARVLTKQGCDVIMACRSVKKAEAARKDILNNLGLSDNYDKLTIMTLDLSSLESIKSFATEFNKKNVKIDYLINNAGVMALPNYSTTKDGFEMQFGINHLGHFYLTNLLMPSLLREDSSSNKNKPRVINVSSLGYYMTDHDYNYWSKMFDDSIDEKKFYPDSFVNDYNDHEGYAISKAANVLFSKELVNKYGKDKIISVSLHPGGITDTNLMNNMNMDLGTVQRWLKFAVKWGMFKQTQMWADMKSIPQGAATSLRLVAMDENEINNGAFYRNCRDNSGDMKGFVSEDKDGRLSKKLWDLSKLLIELKGYSID